MGCSTLSKDSFFLLGRIRIRAFSCQPDQNKTEWLLYLKSYLSTSIYIVGNSNETPNTAHIHMHLSIEVKYSISYCIPQLSPVLYICMVHDVLLGKRKRFLVNESEREREEGEIAMFPVARPKFLSLLPFRRDDPKSGKSGFFLL